MTAVNRSKLAGKMNSKEIRKKKKHNPEQPDGRSLQNRNPVSSASQIHSPMSLGTAAAPSRSFRLRGIGTLVSAAVAVVALGVTFVALDPLPAEAAEPPVGLGTTENFSVLAGSTVTSTGATILSQSLGVHPGSAAVGFPPGEVRGEIHLADAVALQAKSDLTAAYGDAAGRTPFIELPTELGGTILTPGTYRLPAAQLTGTLTLDTLGDPAAVFIFQVTSGLTTATDSEIVFLNDAVSCNIYWQVAGSAAIGTRSDFIGTVMTSTSISMDSDATLVGRALAQTGAVTLISNEITAPVCDSATEEPTEEPTTEPTEGATEEPTAEPQPTDTPPTTVPSESPVLTPTPPGTEPPSATPIEETPPPSGTVPPTSAENTPETTPSSSLTAAESAESSEDLAATGTDGFAPLLIAAGAVLTGSAIITVRRRRGTL